MKRTLVIQAHGKGTRSIRNAFIARGFEVIDSTDEETLMENLAMSPSNMVFIVDDTPTGSKLCTMIRCFSNIPIVALCRKEEQSQLEMLNLGADACVAWPVSPLELTARVQSLLRRYEQLYPPEDSDDTDEK